MNIHLSRDGGQMNQSVCRTAKGEYGSHGVFNRFFRNDVFGGDPGFEERHDLSAGLSGKFYEIGTHGRYTGIAGQTHSQCFRDAGHGVGCGHLDTGARPGAC